MVGNTFDLSTFIKADDFASWQVKIPWWFWRKSFNNEAMSSVRITLHASFPDYCKNVDEPQMIDNDDSETQFESFV